MAQMEENTWCNKCNKLSAKKYLLQFRLLRCSGLEIFPGNKNSSLRSCWKTMHAIEASSRFPWQWPRWPFRAFLWFSCLWTYWNCQGLHNQNKRHQQMNKVQHGEYFASYISNKQKLMETNLTRWYTMCNCLYTSLQISSHFHNTVQP